MVRGWEGFKKVDSNFFSHQLSAKYLKSPRGKCHISSLSRDVKAQTRKYFISGVQNQEPSLLFKMKQIHFKDTDSEVGWKLDVITGFLL